MLEINLRRSALTAQNQHFHLLGIQQRISAKMITEHAKTSTLLANLTPLTVEFSCPFKDAKLPKCLID